MVNNWASTTYTTGNFFSASWAPLAVGLADGQGNISFPVVLPSGLKNIGVFIWTEGQITSGQALTISEPILSDAGAPQIYLPPSYSDELAACLARYAKTFGFTTAPVQNIGNAQGAIRLSGNGGSIDTDCRFPVPMRKVPTCTTFNPLAANANWRDTTASADRTVTLGTATTSAVVINAAGTTTGNQLAIHATAEAEPCS
jgi:hypothetical protein